LVDSVGHNASGFSGLLPEITPELRGQIVQGGGQVPLPPTQVLLAVSVAVCCLVELLRRRWAIPTQTVDHLRVDR
jgi:hypothetical protein